MAIETALFFANGTVSVAAQALGLKRTTLIEKCKRMGINPADFREETEVEKPPVRKRFNGSLAHVTSTQLPIESNIRYEMLMSALETLERHDYNRTRAAKELGICVRTMRMWVNTARDMGLNVPPNPHNAGKAIIKKGKKCNTSK
jgi:transcriptional regulator with PAS, ATPase and Fis domain